MRRPRQEGCELKDQSQNQSLIYLEHVGPQRPRAPAQRSQCLLGYWGKTKQIAALRLLWLLGPCLDSSPRLGRRLRTAPISRGCRLHFPECYPWGSWATVARGGPLPCLGWWAKGVGILGPWHPPLSLWVPRLRAPETNECVVPRGVLEMCTAASFPPWTPLPWKLGRENQPSVVHSCCRVQPGAGVGLPLLGHSLHLQPATRLSLQLFGL